MDALEASKAAIRIRGSTITTQEDLIRDLENAKLINQKEGKNMTRIAPVDTIDVPVDLGMGYIVTIKGMPGRPTQAACERLCKVIMAYAVTPTQKASENIDKDIELTLSMDFMREDPTPKLDLNKKLTK